MKSIVLKLFLIGALWNLISCAPPEGMETSKKSSGSSIQTPGNTGGGSGGTTPASYKLIYTTISEAYVSTPSNPNTSWSFGASDTNDSTTTTQHKYQFMLLGFSGGTPLASSPSDFDIWAPHPSPNGEYIAFPRGGQIAIINRRTNNSISNLTTFSNSDLVQCYIGTQQLDTPQQCLSWSSDSRKIVFEKGAIPSRKIYKIDIQSKSITQIAINNTDSTQPVFAPRSKRIAFVGVTPNFNSNLWLIEEDGTVRQLTNLGGYLDKPTWSPDETLIAFYHTTSRKISFVPVPPSGTTLDKADVIGASRTEVEDGQPVWSPDSLQIAFTTDNLKTSDQNRSINIFNRNTAQLKSIVGDQFGITGGISWINNDEIFFLGNNPVGTPYNVYKTSVLLPDLQKLTNSTHGNYHLKLIKDIAP